MTETGHTLRQALGTPMFWAFALSATVFALVSTGLMLFNEAVLVERGFPREMMLPVVMIVMGAGLVANFLGGWLAEHLPIGPLMGSAMFCLAASLCMLPLAHGPAMVYSYAVAIGLAGGVITVIFFVCWARVFGRRHLVLIEARHRSSPFSALPAGRSLWRCRCITPARPCRCSTRVRARG